MNGVVGDGRSSDVDTRAKSYHPLLIPPTASPSQSPQKAKSPVSSLLRKLASPRALRKDAIEDPLKQTVAYPQKSPNRTLTSSETEDDEGHEVAIVTHGSSPTNVYAAAAVSLPKLLSRRSPSKSQSTTSSTLIVNDITGMNALGEAFSFRIGQQNGGDEYNAGDHSVDIIHSYVSGEICNEDDDTSNVTRHEQTRDLLTNSLLESDDETFATARLANRIGSVELKRAVDTYDDASFVSHREETFDHSQCECSNDVQDTLLEAGSCIYDRVGDKENIGEDLNEIATLVRDILQGKYLIDGGYL